MFKLVTHFKPKGDQEKAVASLVDNLRKGTKHQVLLGVTGSGKTATMSWVIEKLQKPALIISPNKTLCAQLFQEFKDFFPESAVHYFVSYYDYYQPEAYIPQTDTFIEKDAKINEEIERLRHAAVQDLLTRKDVIIAASVSCIYNIGSPQAYQKVSLAVKQGKEITRKKLISHLISLQYQRNDIEFKPGTFRAIGNRIDIFLVTGEKMLRIELTKDKIKSLAVAKNSLSPKYEFLKENFNIFPANFWAAPEEKIGISLENIKSELEERLKELKKQNKLLEAQRIKRRTNFDLEMIQEIGYCSGIENYSRHLEFRKPNEPPFTLIDYFPKDFLVFIDESHQTIPQLKAMSVQDRVRKNSLIEYGFRLPSAIDNRPLTYKELDKKLNQIIYVSATPGKEEKALSHKNGKACIVEQIIRPTGLLEPSIEIRPIKNQINDLITEIKKVVAKKRRVLVITLTKRLSEAIAEYLTKENISCTWIHSEVKTLERPKILNELRQGKYDVLVGINLLREGLDLPEVELVAILDADKEGFLRSETTLIQTMGRASRHVEGRIILYADKITHSMDSAIKEVKRRREIQKEYNKKHDITPKTIKKTIREWPFVVKKKDVLTEFWAVRDKALLEKEMKKAAKELDFERAAAIRDMIKNLKIIDKRKQ